MIWIILVGLFILSIIFLKKKGLLDPVVINSGKLGSKLFIYKDFIGRYRDVGNAFREIGENVASKFKKSQCAGIYYDNPGNVVDQTKCRASVGVVLDPSEKNNAEAWIKNNEAQGFKLVLLPECEMWGTIIPIRGVLTYMTLSHRVYTPLFKKVNENSKKGEFIYGAMEIYESNGGEPFEMAVVVPVGANAKSYFLTEQPMPEYLSMKKEQ